MSRQPTRTRTSSKSGTRGEEKSKPNGLANKSRAEKDDNRSKVKPSEQEKTTKEKSRDGKTRASNNNKEERLSRASKTPTSRSKVKDDKDRDGRSKARDTKDSKSSSRLRDDKDSQRRVKESTSRKKEVKSESKSVKERSRKTKDEPSVKPRNDDAPRSSSRSSARNDRLSSPPRHSHDDVEEPLANAGRKQWDKEHIATDLAQESELQDVQDEVVEEEEEPNYDDDFEDYDEDFEDDVDDDEGDVEEDDDNDENDDDDDGEQDRKMDSGTYDSRGGSSSSYSKRRETEEMEQVKAAMIRENSARYPRRQAQPIEESDDSGKGSPGIEEQSPKKEPRAQSGRTLINFNVAKKKQEIQKAAGKTKKRGDNLKGMISLNVVRFDLMDLPPIRYEAFMKSFGTSNARQETSQTGDDDMEQETQTEPIETNEKWTQKPIAMTSIGDLDDQELLLQNMKGVGGPSKETKVNEGFVSFNAHSHSLRLSQFLEGASQVMLTLMEEQEEQLRGLELEGIEQKSVDFADKVTILNTDMDFLLDRPVTSLAFAPDQSAILLTAHGNLDMDGEQGATTLANFSADTYLCVWNVSQPSAPNKVLVTHNVVSSCCFSPHKASIAFAGLVDGTVVGWDLRESLNIHQEVKRDLTENGDFIFRSPTFSTNAGPDEHNSTIKSVAPLPEAKREQSTEEFNDSGGAFQLISVEEQGCAIIWTVLDNQHDYDQHVGQAHWGSVRLVQSQRIELDSNLYGFTINPHDGSQLLMGMEGGTIHHASTRSNHKPNPRQFLPEFEAHSNPQSLAFCPFGQGFFLVGSDDGTVRLHATTNLKPLITWPGTVDGEPVVELIWSQSRPCVFVLLDNLSRVHLWDLGAGDIYPAHTVHFEDGIEAMALNPDLKDSRQKQLLALGMENGKVEVHHLKGEYKADDSESCQKELSRFLHYVSII